MALQTRTSNLLISLTDMVKRFVEFPLFLFLYSITILQNFILKKQRDTTEPVSSLTISIFSGSQFLYLKSRPFLLCKAVFKEIAQ